MSSIKHGCLAVLALAVIASEATAQARPATRQATQRQAAASTDQGFWELGTDMSVSIGLDTPKSLVISIPTGAVRAGYYVTPALSLEPQLRFLSIATKNATAVSAWALQLGALYHLTPDRRESQIFIHPGLAFTGGSGGGPSFTILSAGAGMKQPMMAGRLLMRVEGGLNYQLKEGTTPARTSLVASLGWSVYTK